MTTTFGFRNSQIFGDIILVNVFRTVNNIRFTQASSLVIVGTSSRQFLQQNSFLSTSSTMQLPKPLSFSRISALPGIEVPLVHIRSDGSVTRKTSTLDDIMRNLTWIDEKGKKQKMPLRDLRCFIPSHGLNKKSIESPLQSIHASPFHKEIGLPAIMPRAKARCYLLDLGLLKLLCRQDSADILYSDDSNNNLRNYVNSFVSELKASLAQNSRLGGGAASSSDLNHEQQHEPIAFEIQVLETALSCVVTKFYKQLALVEPLLDGLIDDATSQPTEIKVGRLAALKKSLFEYNQGVQAIIQAIRGLLSNNRDMADMYLGAIHKDSNDHEEVEFLLEAYVADLAEIEMEATGMIAQIEDSMEVISLHLNSQRNRIIKLSLIMEMLAVTAGSGAVIGSIFGMNLKSGLEESGSGFYVVTGITTFMMSSILVGLLLRFRHLVVARPVAGVDHQHSALKHFFSYVDAIETKVRLSDSITRKEFEAIVRKIIGDPGVDPKEIDLFFKVLDNNKNNCIELSELPPLPSSKFRAYEEQPSSDIIQLDKKERQTLP